MESPIQEAVAPDSLYAEQKLAVAARAPLRESGRLETRAQVHPVTAGDSERSRRKAAAVTPVDSAASPSPVPLIRGVENGELFRRRERTRRSQQPPFWSSFSSPGEAPAPNGSAGGDPADSSFCALYRRELLSARPAPRVQLEELLYSIDAGDDANVPTLHTNNSERESLPPQFAYTYINSPYVQRRRNAPSIDRLYYSSVSEPAGTSQCKSSVSSCERRESRASRASILTVEDAIRILKGEHDDTESNKSGGGGARSALSGQLELPFPAASFGSFVHSQQLSWSSTLSPPGELLRAASEIFPTACQPPHARMNFSSTNLSSSNSNSNSTATPSGAIAPSAATTITTYAAPTLHERRASSSAAAAAAAATKREDSCSDRERENEKRNGDGARHRPERRFSSSSSTSSTDTVLRVCAGSTNFDAAGADRSNSNRRSTNAGSPAVHLRTTGAQTDLMFPPSLQWPPASANGPNSQANQWRHSLPLFLLDAAPPQNGPSRPKSAHVGSSSGNVSPYVTLAIQDGPGSGYIYSCEYGPAGPGHAFLSSCACALQTPSPKHQYQHTRRSNSTSKPSETTQCSQCSPSHAFGPYQPYPAASPSIARTGGPPRAISLSAHRQNQRVCSGEISLSASISATATATPAAASGKVAGRRMCYQQGFDLRISEEDRSFATTRSDSDAQLASPHRSSHNS